MQWIGDWALLMTFDSWSTHCILSGMTLEGMQFPKGQRVFGMKMFNVAFDFKTWSWNDGGKDPGPPRHNNGIAVFMDFVGAHFAKDEWGLVEYSGVAQYEYEGDLGEIPGWGTARYNYAKAEVQAYLLGALPKSWVAKRRWRIAISSALLSGSSSQKKMIWGFHSSSYAVLPYVDGVIWVDLCKFMYVYEHIRMRLCVRMDTIIWITCVLFSASGTNAGNS